MKKAWLIALITILFLTACGASDAVEPPTSTPITLPTVAATKTAVSITPEPETETDSEPASILPIRPVDDTESEQIDLLETVGTDEPVIMYSKSGGFAGLEQEWNIYANGRIENSDGKLVGQADPEEITAVVLMADEVGFYELDDEYLDKNNDCCDLITYTLTVTDGEQTKTVITRDNSPRPPAYVMVSTAVENLIHDNPITE